MVKLSNPFAFTPGPVTFFTTIIYAALLITLIIIHTTPLPAPNSPTSIKGVDLTEAWGDLQSLTKFYHPFNSHANDEVRAYLLSRIDEIVVANKASVAHPDLSSIAETGAVKTGQESPAVYVFNDLSTNVTSSSTTFGGVQRGISAYFESTNIIVYIRGTEDDQSDWWERKNGSPTGQGGVLVNAHYDSVSTGYGATDDGMGVVSILQLIKYYSNPDHTPRRGLVALLNNGEEGFLKGAVAFGGHPLSKLPHTFVNLEGAGAGGRAHLFRATDAQVAHAYRKTPRPFSSVLSSDGFKMGAIASQTDYIIFNNDLGMRGLDIAFMEPRARYHTDEDDTRHTGKDSLWHMLSAALATTKELTSDSSSEFDGESGEKGKVNAGKGSVGVWFDVLGSAFAVYRLHTFFALSVTLLVVAPIFLLLTSLILYKVDKFYLFSGSRLYHVVDGDEEIKLYGWRGFFRFPVIIVLTGAIPVALAYLLTKQNPFIIHSSQWSVWAMMASAWIYAAWFLCCAAYYTRPSALTRIYGYIWISTLLWAALVADTVFETQFKLAGGYFIVFYFAALFIPTWLSHLELFALPRKSKYCHGKMGGYESMAQSQILPEDDETTANDAHEEADEEDANETTSLLQGQNRRTTFANYSRNEDGSEPNTPRPQSPESKPTYGVEQEWSTSLPRWTWLLQLIIIVPIAVIFSGQTGLLLTSATHQTGQDGSSVLMPYMIQAVFTILTLLPLIPVIHRMTWHVPHFLLLVLIGTLVYNLLAFPFSTNNRLKLYFQQTVDIDTGVNKVTLQGPQPFLNDAISRLPSAAGQDISCVPALGREALDQCSWNGLAPQVVPAYGKLPSERQYQLWVNYNITSQFNATPSGKSARIFLGGKDTRACKLTFDEPITKFQVLGAGPDDRRFPSVPNGGSQEIRLYSRTWGRVWGVDVAWEQDEDDEEDGIAIDGKVTCSWSDDNQVGLIPALDEARHYAPDWTAFAQRADGLVEASKSFSIRR